MRFKKSLAASKSPMVLLVLLCCILWSCASDVANRYYGTTKYPPKNPKDVQILHTAPSQPHDVIADFQSRGESPEDIRRKAAAIGADAVIVVILGGSYSRNEEWAGSDSYGNTYSHICGTAIKYR